MKVKISNQDLQQFISGKSPNFPKYSTQIMNLANANAQGTRPSVVGQMSDLIQEFPGKTLTEWENWYRRKNPTAIKDATEKIYNMVQNLQNVIHEIDKELVEKWVEDLVILKTFVGLKLQTVILQTVANQYKKKYRFSSPAEESKGIDGYINEVPVSIKPVSYKLKKTLVEQINAKMIYYEEKKDGLVIECDL